MMLCENIARSKARLGIFDGRKPHEFKKTI